jgi:hypothetical protein
LTPKSSGDGERLTTAARTTTLARGELGRCIKASVVADVLVRGAVKKSADGSAIVKVAVALPFGAGGML